MLFIVVFSFGVIINGSVNNKIYFYVLDYYYYKINNLKLNKNVYCIIDMLILNFC